MSEPHCQLISARHAAEILGAKAGLTRRQARRVLDWELAGTPVRTRSAVLHDEANVRRLAARAVLSRADALDVCRGGLIIVRVGARPGSPRQDGPSLDDPSLAALPQDISALTAVVIEFMIDKHGPMPLVTTVAGWVAAGVEVTETVMVPGATPPKGFRALTPRRFQVRAPGAWFDDLRATRIPTGPGPAWLLWPPR